MPPHLALVFGVAAVSSAALLIKLAGEASPLVIGAYRLGIASLIVLPSSILIAGRDFRGYSSAQLAWALASGVFLALHFAFWIASLRYTSVTSSVVLVTTTPLMVAMLPSRWTGDSISRRTVLGILIALLGTTLIAFGDAGAGPGTLWGDGLALLGAAAMAGNWVVGRRLMRQLPLPAYISVIYPVAALVLLAAAAVSGGPFTGFAPATYAALVMLALLPQVIGHSTLNWALSRLGVVAVSTAVMGEPVGATLLVLLFLGEAPGWSQVGGGAVVLAGVYLALGSHSADQRSAR